VSGGARGSLHHAYASRASVVTAFARDAGARALGRAETLSSGNAGLSASAEASAGGGRCLAAVKSSPDYAGPIRWVRPRRGSDRESDGQLANMA
jgi:hypothetical protein